MVLLQDYKKKCELVKSPSFTGGCQIFIVPRKKYKVYREHIYKVTIEDITHVIQEV